MSSEILASGEIPATTQAAESRSPRRSRPSDLTELVWGIRVQALTAELASRLGLADLPR